MTPTMTAVIDPFTPITPPPDSQTFAQKPVPLQLPLNPPLRSSFYGMGWGLEVPLPPLATFSAKDSRTQQQPQRLNQPQLHKPEEGESSKREPPTIQPPPPSATPAPVSAASQRPQAPAETQPQQKPGARPQVQTLGSTPAHTDPNELAMAARMAAFYQQRCHAIATYQQQQCQAWAIAYRKKCHETMQAATLVVAWYVRDRIRRRRRRQKDRFRRGLREKRTRPRPVGKGEAVRQWVMQVPSDALPPSAVAMNNVADKEEMGFSIDGKAPPDKDSKLLEIADGLIKCHYRNIEVPLMGVLSFDESDSESEASMEFCAGCNGRPSEIEAVEDPHNDGGEDDDYDGYEEEELFEDEDMDGDDEWLGSELVQGGGTGPHSQDTEEILPLL